MSDQEPVPAPGRGRGETGESLNERAYLEVRSDIVRCVLAPGEALTERELVGRYGFGKGPIRTALTRLRHDGLVQSSPRRGWTVAAITLRDVHELFQVRLILEPQVARLAAGHIDERLVRELDEIVQRGYVPGDPDSQAEFLEANRRFHVSIAAATGNDRLTAMINRCMEEIGRVLHLGLATANYGDRYQHEHRELIAALVDGDAEAAESLAHAAIAGGEQMALTALLKTSTIVDVPLAAASVRRAS